MADNVQGDISGNILVETDYNNIILVDPNKTMTPDGVIKERLVDHENLIMFANLEAQVIPRTKLALGIQPGQNVSTSMTIARINFLRPQRENYLGSGYLDEITGKDSLVGRAQNQPQQTTQTDENNKAYFRNSLVDQQSAFDNGLLGITSISVKLSTSFIPSVSIQLEDIQGRALFQLGDQSPYSAFFNLPYPQFYLTLKGYYGQAIRYQLNLEKFDARFNTSTGNYSISLEFRGFKFNVLNEILISHLIATPHMYNKRFSVGFDPANANTSTNDKTLQTEASSASSGKINTSSSSNLSVVQDYVTERGYEKILEVYSEYKQKKLIPPDFPEITLMQLIYKFDMFEQNVINSYPKQNVEPLTNIKNYQNFVKEFSDEIKIDWSKTYLDPRPIVLNNDTRVYYFRQAVRTDPATQQRALDSLKNITTTYLTKLGDNPTLGLKRKDKIELNNLSYENFFINILQSDINTGKTAQSFTSPAPPTTADELRANAEINRLFTEVKDLKLFIFEGQNRFDDIIRLINSEASKKLSIIQQAITQELADFVQDSALGIGFKPTARNIIAVIMANTEGFIRLLDEVHTNAWNVKDNPVRRLIIQNNDKSIGNPEAMNTAQISGQAANRNQGLVDLEAPVYPWPQFFVESPDDKKGRYQLEYLGNSSVLQKTQAYNFKIWPEVEFVEEYIKGLAQKNNPPSSQPPLDSQLTTFLTQINAIEYPPSNLPYSNRQEIKFLYEIWERQYLSAFYSNYIRVNGGPKNKLLVLNTSGETQNIVTTLGNSNPFLSFTLKNENLNPAVYPAYLRKSSADGKGSLWLQFERGFFNTPYIIEETENPFKIYKLNELGLQPETLIPSEALEQIASQYVNNEPIFLDTFPFVNQNWVTQNMSLGNRAQGNQVYNTTNTLKVFEPRRVISNFKNLYDYTTNRAVTNFCYLNTNLPSIVTPNTGTNFARLDTFYKENIIPSKFVPTEGLVLNLESKNLPKEQTTSILNTPYFINAIQNGTVLEKNRQTYPYVQAAYLFLNSLPVATLRERYKIFGEKNQLDYISSCFNKYGALHKVPYAWVLKLGAAWHRYKNYVDNGVDILDNVWNNFNYLENYDPINSATTREYQFKETTTGPTTTIVLESKINNSVNMNVGFYPKLINDFSYFLNGSELFSKYTDDEIQTAAANGMCVFNFPNSNISANQNGLNVNLKTWSVVIPSTLKETSTSQTTCIPVNNAVPQAGNYFIIPSFGFNINQASSQCLQNPNNTTVQQPSTIENLTGNTSMYNGTIRTLWSTSNYGYFNTSGVTKPQYYEYLTEINPLVDEQSPMNLKMKYSSIEEIFGVFDRKTLNIMEKEFLEFSKPANAVKFQRTKTEIGSTLIELDNSLRNFQLFMRNIMAIPTKTQNVSNLDYFNSGITSQYNTFINNVKNLMEYDVLLKNGNPGKYNRRIFNSFNPSSNIQDPIKFKPYIPNSLPTNGGTTTLAQSQALYPIEWETLQLEVGFSTINGLRYSDQGSYITDFFVDNNIEFNNRNIQTLSQLIKIYATQKLLNPNLTSSQFKSNLNTFMSSESELQNLFLGEVVDQVKKNIKEILPPRDQTIQSQISGDQGKSELYNLFKAVNDKWISGTDYSNQTLFEDILFLDRASRNIGDTIILDIFAVKNLINTNALNEQMSVYTLISGLLMQNNFTVMPLPAYVNFYNVKSFEGNLTPNTEEVMKFGNNLWGTFTNVDYRESGPKMVCFYVGKPSEQLPLPRQVSGYGDDGFDLRNPGNPCVEDQTNKTDFNLSNKCVGFTVDIGIRNQNVFQNFSVSQDNGKATSESIAALLTMINQTNTRNVATQNSSLYNLYKRRNYQCDVTCMGNALLQPTMYFNLRHVPMFNGPYFITEVTHTITSGDFTTNFKGTRQGIYDFPPVDTFLQKINQNLLTKIESILLQQTDKNSTLTTTEQGKSANLLTNTGLLKKAEVNSCNRNLDPQFLNYRSENGQSTDISTKEFSDAIRNKFPNNAQLQTLIYILSYVRTFSNPGKAGNFVCLNNNVANITLDTPIPVQPALQFFEKETCSCAEIPTLKGYNNLPVARFETLDKFLEFMQAIIQRRESQLVQGGVLEYYCTSFPPNKISKEEFDKNIELYKQKFLNLFDQALVSAKDNGLIADFKVLQQQTSGAPNNLNTVSNPPTCPDATVTDYRPQTGTTGTIISLSGTNLEYVREISVGGNIVDLRSVVFINTNKIKFSIPRVTQTPPSQLQIVIKTVNQQIINVTPLFNFT